MPATLARPSTPRTHLRPLRLLSDEQLAALIAEGDQDAFAAAYDRYLPALVRYCRGILLSAEDAEDAAQSAMLSALRALPERPPQVLLRAWLFRVAHNEAISMIRRRRPHEPLEHALPAGDGDPADVAGTRARLGQLVVDLRALPERQRGALLMRELCGLGYAEIAGALGSSEAAAMQTVFEARSSLIQFDEGRTMSCSSVRRSISDGDGRRLRARRLRAHVRGCEGCRTFERSLTTRRRELALLVPVAGKGGLLALLGALGGGSGMRVLGGVVSRGQLVPPGARAVALGAVIAATGGGVASQLTHPAAPARPHPTTSAAGPGHALAPATDAPPALAALRARHRAAAAGAAPRARLVAVAAAHHRSAARERVGIVYRASTGDTAPSGADYAPAPASDAPPVPADSTRPSPAAPAAPPAAAAPAPAPAPAPEAAHGPAVPAPAPTAHTAAPTHVPTVFDLVKAYASAPANVAATALRQTSMLCVRTPIGTYGPGCAK
jgi:RNA polymerase sigma factor (sigma-70 family)